MTNDKHSETPWAVTVDGNRITGARGNDICKTFRMGTDPDEQRANATRICLCVNTHDELVGALEACQAELVTLKARLSEPYRRNVSAAVDVATRALTRVKGDV